MTAIANDTETTTATVAAALATYATKHDPLPSVGLLPRDGVVPQHEDAPPPPPPLPPLGDEVRRALAERNPLIGLIGVHPDADQPSLNEAQREEVGGLVATLLWLVEGGQPDDPRAELRAVYDRLSALLRRTVLGGEAVWPSPFWDTPAGHALYHAFAHVYGDDLMLNSDAEERYGLDLSRIGQVQRDGLMDYIENPYVAHHNQRRRRVTSDMVEAFLTAHPPKGPRPGTVGTPAERRRARRARLT